MRVTLVGGPTAILEYAGARIVIDPTFDPPGTYPNEVGEMVKTRGPEVPLDELGHVDIVLASHEHDDNLDRAGRGVLRSADRVFTTPVVAELVGRDVDTMQPGDSSTVRLSGGSSLTVHAVPAKHGPDGIWEMSTVIGFVLTSEGGPTVYISGDNSELDVVHTVPSYAGPIDVAILFAGRAGFDSLDGQNLTLSAADAVEAARTLKVKKAILVHHDSWEHFREDLATGVAAFDAAGMSDVLVPLQPGESAVVCGDTA
ncbi:L-ascorbate metabolism protein UlaG (beta-lactamase superfamily) [Brevibacterium sanguinis]|uniref:L-ascorbate metabolism protein UlaG (Beta-lactamase superfamily) n=2 Tax=Brevibacterium TaxID=1696 RepID=A0A366INW8_9MICO|nr:MULTISPECIES: MBL fold metallo-hydrolase [Brevibacterium]RBP67818.1 L-ascorbate metabolism protein UlaG (beta-lactamase superfamily) [Brevibacterium sanguinis]RBP74765.1 L-ascorbate metabolism protein UlaG (beta-lactamase superfamily) [Brevibacterium celere]